MDKQLTPLKSNFRVLLAKNKMNMTQLSGLSGVSRYKISELQDEIPVTTKIVTLMKLAGPLDVNWIDLIELGRNDSQNDT